MDTDVRTKQVWSTGTYDETARQFLPMAARLVAASDVGPDDRVLDVACGTGNVAITAARRGASVTGLDITPSMLEAARENAAIADLAGIDWREGTATALPFADDSFDVSLSNLGHMYGQPAAEAARELHRVTMSGGRIGFTAWTPTTLYPAMAGVLVTYLPADALPDMTDPPFMWGDADVVRSRLGEAVTDLGFETGATTIPALSPAHFWERTAATSGVFITYLEDVAAANRPALRADMVETIAPFFDDTTNTVELEYLQTTATVATDQ